MRALLLLPLFVMCSAAADGGGVSGPVSGYVFDAGARALRAVPGLPGAAYVGDPVVADADAASAAPGGRFALAVKEGRLYLATGLAETEPAVTAVEGAIEGVDRFAWAPEGASAAVYSPKAGRAQIVRTAGAAGEPLETPGEVTALAVAADTILAGVAGENGGVYLLGAGAARMLAPAGRPSGIAVAGRDLYFTDRERGQVWQVREFASEATPLLFAEGLREPVGVQIEGRRLFVANAGDSAVEIFDLDLRASAARLELNAPPEGLEAFGGRALWILKTGSPVYVLDGGAQEPAVYFIPAGAPAAK